MRIASQIIFLHRQKKKSVFVYVHNHSRKVPGGPLDLVGFQNFFVFPFFLKGTV